ncbi:MAG TPA: TetR-like C-terminal domain-containing protein, partial [Anaerolineales bacterium]|nr:TetR-like C-terminal domain-containing protein [Anaerolineales bacterium]
PDRFKLMFSSVLEKEKEYADFVEISQDAFAQLVDIVETYQQAGLLKTGPSDVAAVSIWSTVHGFTSLLLEDQISHTVLDKASLKDLLSLII